MLKVQHLKKNYNQLEVLKDIHFDACISSPLPRAINTAKEIIKGKEIPFYINDHFIEFNFGSLEGESEERLVEVYPIFLGQKVEGFDGDTMEQLVSRLMQGLEEIYLQYPNGRILIVTHSGAISALLKYLQSDKQLLSKDNKSANVDNCSITILKRTTKWIIEEVNNTTYLSKGLRSLFYKEV